jgi:transcriptional regulator with XRE-family HTH domain
MVYFNYKMFRIQWEGIAMSIIKQLRKQASLTQVELAKKAGVSIPTLNRMERNKVVTNPSLLCVCYALGISPEEVNDVRVRGAV